MFCSWTQYGNDLWYLSLLFVSPVREQFSPVSHFLFPEETVYGIDSAVLCKRSLGLIR